MPVKYKVHPAIGIARLGNSPDELYISPEVPGGLPIASDQDGNTTLDADGKEKTTSDFKDPQGRVKRQAARFRVWVYDDQSPEGRPLQIGDPIQGVGSKGKLADILWSVYPANKKASWYSFEQLSGELGYAPDHPRRNADIKGDSARQMLNIDPGSQWVDCTHHRRASFANGKNPNYAQIYPPPLTPDSIDTLGEIFTDSQARLLFLGGYGSSGSVNSGLTEPRIDTYANNDGWFDDVSDGPVQAILKYWDEEDLEFRYIEVDDPAWVIVGYPRFAPQILDMVTMDEVLYDLAVRDFAYDTYLYGTGDFKPHAIDPNDPGQLQTWRGSPKWYNPNYYPYFWRQIWPILSRPWEMQWVTAVLQISEDAHDPGPRGDFDLSKISVPPGPDGDPNRDARLFIWMALRKAGQENEYVNTTAPPWTKNYLKELMPLLSGDNPISNELPSKFLRLTDTMLFYLQQWAEGKFINEKDEGFQGTQIEPLPPGEAIDRGVLANVLGGAFCPGGEASWIMRNPQIYEKPYRIKQNSAYVPTSGSTRGFDPASFMPSQALTLDDSFADGLGPGDLTKYAALPWQADFNECSWQTIDVSYELWNVVYPPAVSKTNPTLWWPAHRPMEVYKLNGSPPEVDPTNPGSYSQVEWAQGIPQTDAGDLKMVTAWKALGFVAKNPAWTSSNGVPKFIEVDD